MKQNEMEDITNCPTGTDFAWYVYPIAEEVVREKNGELWMALWMTSICVLETGWGKSVSGVLGNNICGYHAIIGKPVIETTEAGTGDAQNYRYFPSFKSCLKSLYYLLSQSSNFNKARETYEVQKRNARTMFMGNISHSYSEDPEHSQSVISIYQTLEKQRISDPTR